MFRTCENSPLGPQEWHAQFTGVLDLFWRLTCDRANSLLDYAAKVTNKGQFKVLVSDLKQ